MNELEQAIAGVGHNLAPIEATAADNIVSCLEESNVDLLTRGQQLLNAMQRLPKICEDTETAQRLTTFGNQLKSCADTFEERRKIEKKPYDDMASAVQGFFKGRIEALTNGIGEVKTVLKRYMDAEEAKRIAAEQERRIAEEKLAVERQIEAQKLLDAAAKLQEQGMSNAADIALGQAQEAEQASIAATQAALDTPKQAIGSSMIRGSAGGGSSSSKKWVFEIEDVAKLDLQALRPYFDLPSLQKAGNAYMKVATKNLRPNEEAKQISGAKMKRESNISLRG